MKNCTTKDLILKLKIVNVNKLYKIQSKNKYNLINILNYIFMLSEIAENEK